VVIQPKVSQITSPLVLFWYAWLFSMIWLTRTTATKHGFQE
jgi:hypothetical protein